MDEADRHRLAPAELERIYRSLVVPVLFGRLNRDQAPETPTAVIFGGQPGSGKTAAVDAAVTELGRATARNQVVQIVGDDLRAYHPRYAEFTRQDDQTAALYTGKDVGVWVEMAMRDAIKQRCHVVVEGTMRSPDVVARTASLFKEAGYRVEARALAIPERLSWQGVIQRYEDQREAKGAGRMSPVDMHAAAVLGVPKSLDRLQDLHLVDRIALYRRGGDEIFATELTPGAQWQPPARASEALLAERNRPWTREEHDQYVDRWARLNARLEQPERQATTAELEEVRQSLRRAQNERASEVFLSAQRRPQGELPEVAEADRYMLAMSAAGRIAGLAGDELTRLEGAARDAVALRLKHGLPPLLGPTQDRDLPDAKGVERVAGREVDRSR